MPGPEEDVQLANGCDEGSPQLKAWLMVGKSIHGIYAV